MMLSCRGAGVAPFFARFEAWRRSLLLISLLMGLVCLCLSLFLCCEFHRCFRALRVCLVESFARCGGLERGLMVVRTSGFCGCGAGELRRAGVPAGVNASFLCVECWE